MQGNNPDLPFEWEILYQNEKHLARENDHCDDKVPLSDLPDLNSLEAPRGGIVFMNSYGECSISGYDRYGFPQNSPSEHYISSESFNYDLISHDPLAFNGASKRRLRYTNSFHRLVCLLIES